MRCYHYLSIFQIGLLSRILCGLNAFKISTSDIRNVISLNSAPLPSGNDETRSISKAVVDPSTQIDLLYDSDCPICQMEADFLKKRDINNKIRFTDLSSPDYDPAQHGNVSFEAGMRKIRAVLPDKTVVVGVEVFRKTYEAIGLGWIFEITKFPVVGKVADKVYDIWAENRLRLTGRGDLADLVRVRSEQLSALGPVECDENGCGIDYGDNANEI